MGGGFGHRRQEGDSNLTDSVHPSYLTHFVPCDIFRVFESPTQDKKLSCSPPQNTNPSYIRGICILWRWGDSNPRAVCRRISVYMFRQYASFKINYTSTIIQ